MKPKIILFACAALLVTGCSGKTSSENNDKATAPSGSLDISGDMPTDDKSTDSSSFETNLNDLTKIQTALMGYKKETGSFPVAKRTRKVGVPLKVLGLTDLPTKPSGAKKAAFYYESDGSNFKLTVQNSGDCHRARYSDDVIIDPKFSAGPVDCTAYGLMSAKSVTKALTGFNATKSFDDNVKILKDIKAGLDLYKAETGQYPVVKGTKLVSKALSPLKTKYGTNLPARSPNLKSGRYFYESDGESYRLLARKTGDCHIARQSPQVMIDERQASGSKDCLSYALKTG